MPEYHPLKELFLSRTRQFFREPETIFWVYFFPLILMAALGLAFRDSTQEHRIRIVAATDVERNRLSDALVAHEGLRVETIAADQIDLEKDPFDFDLSVVSREGVIEYHYDPTHAANETLKRRVDDILQRDAGRQDAVATAIVPFTRPGMRYIDFLIPGLMALNIMGSGLWGVGFVAVDMRIRRLLKRFRATPMRRRDYMFSLVGARLIFLVPEMTTILLVGHLAFGLDVQGSLLSVFAVGLVGASSFAGLGLLIASRAQKLETISGLLNLVMMPMWMLSGVFFDASRFPDAMQPIVQTLPLTQLVHAMRGVILEGQNLLEVGPHLAVVAIWGGLAFPLALKLFRWK